MVGPRPRGAVIITTDKNSDKKSLLALETFERYSVAMTALLSEELKSHLLRDDGQEDICLAVYKPSKGATRFTAILCEAILPEAGERYVHGIVTFTGQYVLRVAHQAALCGGGVSILHSHPRGRNWQYMSEPDREAEEAFAFLAHEITGLPLVGMTLAGDSQVWSARVWCAFSSTVIQHRDAESVRTIGDTLKIDWNKALRPVPAILPALKRTASCWGEAIQADIARLNVLIVGLGTIGIDVAARVSATGIEHIGAMDFDGIELINLDRLLAATSLDVWLHRSKLEVVAREMERSATAANFRLSQYEGSICEPNSIQQALDFDLIFCCVDDHPWPRSILNMLAYTDLIPVIDGGVHIDAFERGTGLRNATWRSHVLRPGRACMACIGQLDTGNIHADKNELFEDADYISGLPNSERPANQNVSLVASGAVSGLLGQFVSLMAAPAGTGEPGPLRFSLSTHWLEHLEYESAPHCPVEAASLQGDDRVVLAAPDKRARSKIEARMRARSMLTIRIARAIDDAIGGLRRTLTKAIAKRSACESNRA